MTRSPESLSSREGGIALLPADYVIDPRAEHFEGPPIDLIGIGQVRLHGEKTYVYRPGEFGIAYMDGHVRIDQATRFRQEGCFELGVSIRPLLGEPLLYARLILPDDTLTLETRMELGEDWLAAEPYVQRYAATFNWYLPSHPQRLFILFDRGDAPSLQRFRFALRRHG